MPYKLVGSGGQWFVEDDKGKRYSSEPLPRKRAVAQMRVLYAAETKEYSPRKTVAGKPRSAGDFLVIEDPDKPSTWRLPVRVDGEIDRRLMGAAWAALHEGYRGQKYAGPKKDIAIKKLERLYEANNIPTPAAMKEYACSIAVFKDKADNWRWVTVSSNPYKDRDGEFVSMKSLQADVDRADKDGDYGTLRWWHVPGMDIGKADFNMLYGKMLVESGTFYSPEIAQRVKSRAKELEVSLGFLHPPNEPDRDGVYYTIRRFERSLVPKGRVSNLFTNFIVHKEH